MGNDPINMTDPTGLAGSHLEHSLSIQMGIAYDLDVASEYAERNMPDNKAAQGARAVAAEYRKNVALVNQIKSSTHGNSKASTKPQHRYEIRDKTTGDVKKTGISGQGLNKDGSSPRANSQVNSLNKTEGTDKYEATVKETDIPGRAAALNSEQAATNQLNADGHSLERQCRPKPNLSGGC